MRRFALLAVLMAVAPVRPAAAQFGPPVIVARPLVWGGFGWGGGVFWVVPQPPVVIVRPVVVPQFVEEPWVPEPPPRRATPQEKAAAEERVNGAVARGELMVVTPGKPVARRPEPPPAIAPPPPAKPAAPAVTLDPPAWPREPNELAAARVLAGRAAFAAEEYGRAVDHFCAATLARPTEPEAYFLLAQARTARGEYAEAVAAIRDGMRRVPNWPAARFDLAALYGDRRAPLAAHLTALREAADAPTATPAARFLYAYHLWFAGEKAAAARRFRALSAAVKDNAEIELFLLEAEGKKL